jgi:hypothetical protein
MVGHDRVPGDGCERMELSKVRIMNLGALRSKIDDLLVVVVTVRRSNHGWRDFGVGYDYSAVRLPC